MKRRVSWLTGLVFLAIMLPAAPLAAEDTYGGRGPDVPLDSLVLVLNLISSTHARPATGVVLAGKIRAGNSLVVVPASFVGAGDEIIVLDGGNDILRHGRSTRTIARSAEAGIAVLEVEGMVRAGVALASDAWPSPANPVYGFAAWPGAGALAEGASLVRRALGPGASFPEVSGPLFDACGNLAAMFLAEGEGRVSAGEELAETLDAYDIEYTESACTGTPVDAGSLVVQEPGASLEPGEDIPETEPDGAAVAVEPPRGKLSSLALTPAQKTGLLIAWLVLGLLAFFLYLRRRKREKPGRIVLERRAVGGQRFLHTLQPGRDGQSAQYTHDKSTLNLRLTAEGLEVAIPEDEHRDRVGFLLDGAPCLCGEKFIIRPGQEIRLGGETFQWVMDSDEPEIEQEHHERSG